MITSHITRMHVFVTLLNVFSLGEGVSVGPRNSSMSMASEDSENVISDLVGKLRSLNHCQLQVGIYHCLMMLPQHVHHLKSV